MDLECGGCNGCSGKMRKGRRRRRSGWQTTSDAVVSSRFHTSRNLLHVVAAFPLAAITSFSYLVSFVATAVTAATARDGI